LKPSPCRGRFAAVLAVLAGGALAAPATAAAALAITTQPSDPTVVRAPMFAGGGALPDLPVTVVLAPVDGGADPPDLEAVPDLDGNWAATSGGLADGTYTATATQVGNDSSAPAQFRVDTIAPAPTVTQPAALTADSTPALGGAAGNDTGDSSTMSVEVRAGSGGSGATVSSLAATRSGGSWSATAPSLPAGPYSARATQADSAGNAGQSAWRDFTVVAASFTISPDPPVAASPTTFTASPQDVQYAWDLDGDGQFDDGNGATATHTYANTTAQTVGVQITTPDGGVSTATRSIAAVDGSAPVLTVTKPGPVTASSSPVLGGAAGNAAGDKAQVRVELHRLSQGAGDLVQVVDVSRSRATWTYTVPGPLAPGAYSVRATQSDKTGNVTTTPWLDFTIVVADFTITPEDFQVGATVTLTALTAGVSYAWDLDDDGAFDDGTARTVTRAVTSAASRRVLLQVTAPDGTTSTATRSIMPGNRAPNADFDVSPGSPIAGQPVRLTSTSSDPDGQPLASEAWDLDGDGQFDEATGGIVSMVFPTAGTYRIGLRVIDPAGASREATKFITVGSPPPPPPSPQPQTGGGSDPSTGPAPAPPPPPGPAPAPAVAPTQRPLLSPFPIVRIVGEVTSRGIRLRRLSVTAPKGATVRARCKRTGCPRKIAALRARSTAGIRIRGLERRELRAGTVIDVFVAAKGRIGKYTRLLVRRGKAPERGDRCLSTNGWSPISCPVG
jgi:PKD domain/Bacterial Ig-like domain